MAAKDETGTLYARVPNGLLERIDQIAADSSLNKAMVVRVLLEHALKDIPVGARIRIESVIE